VYNFSSIICYLKFPRPWKKNSENCLKHLAIYPLNYVSSHP
jgi:hypothetical protein